MLLARIACFPERSVGSGPRRAEDPALQDLRVRLERVAASPLQLNEVAWGYGERGDAPGGLPFVERAVRVDPTCWQCFDTLSVLQSKSGDLDAALEANGRARSLLPEGQPPKSLEARRAKFEAALAARKKPH